MSKKTASEYLASKGIKESEINSITSTVDNSGFLIHMNDRGPSINLNKKEFTEATGSNELRLNRKMGRRN